jgi:hypothetical protein
MTKIHNLQFPLEYGIQTMQDNGIIKKQGNIIKLPHITPAVVSKNF